MILRMIYLLIRTVLEWVYGGKPCTVLKPVSNAGKLCLSQSSINIQQWEMVILGSARIAPRMTLQNIA
jgi:hypothetical protein